MTAASLCRYFSWRRRVPLAAVVAAALHGDGQLVCPAEGGDEQRDKQGTSALARWIRLPDSKSAPWPAGRT